MLRCKPVVGQQHAHAGQGGQPHAETAIRPRQVQTPRAAVQVEDRAALTQATLAVPGRRHAAGIDALNLSRGKTTR